MTQVLGGSAQPIWIVNPEDFGVIWGGITGTLSDQTDLQTELDTKADIGFDTLSNVLVVDPSFDGNTAGWGVTAFSALSVAVLTAIAGDTILVNDNIAFSEYASIPVDVMVRGIPEDKNILNGAINSVDVVNTSDVIVIIGHVSGDISDTSHTSIVLGGTAASPHSIGVNSYLSSILGGYDNAIGDDSFANSIISSHHSSINTSTHSNISSGSTLLITGCNYSVAYGGLQNNILNSNYGGIFAGRLHSLSGNQSIIAGGVSSDVDGESSMALIGLNLSVAGDGSCAIGGNGNSVAGDDSAVACGTNCAANADHALIMASTSSVISALSTRSAIIASENAIIDDLGANNSILAVVIGGSGHRITNGDYSAIIAGLGGRIDGRFSIVLGGRSAEANAEYALAAGYGAKANHRGSRVFADSNVFDFDSTAIDEFAVQATGGHRVVTAIDGSGNPTAVHKMTHLWNQLPVVSFASLPLAHADYAGAIAMTSDGKAGGFGAMVCDGSAWVAMN